MPIDVSEIESDGWWMQRLFRMLTDRERRNRLQKLYDYHRGNAPLPQGAENTRKAFEALQKKARSNFAELIVSVMSERMQPVGFRTAVEDDATGDADVNNMWYRAGLAVTSADVHDFMLALSEAYVIVGPMDAESNAPLATCEDPRYMVGDADPANPRRLVAALKVLHDDARNQDRAYLYRPGKVRVAVRDLGRSKNSVHALYGPSQRSGGPRIGFDPKGWTWDEDLSGPLDHDRMPVVLFRNKYGLGEYEIHTDLLDRINHEILSRMIIAVMQAFRQRAVRNLPLTYPAGHPKANQEIDYNEVFSADPAALWLLPEGAEMWESAINDLRPNLDAIKADLEHLAAVTRTPLHMLTAAGVNQSAEGASLAREGLVFKVEDRIARVTYPWAQVMSLMLLQAGETERADLSKLTTIWASPQRLSLQEKADAASKLTGILPPRTMMIDVIGMAPGAADRTMTEIEDERLVAAQLAAAAATAAGGTTTRPAAGPAAPQRTVPAQPLAP